MNISVTAERCMTKLRVEFAICGSRTFFRVVHGGGCDIQYNEV